MPRIRCWLTSLPHRPAEFIEPFAGGAIVSLTVLFEGLADHVTIVELDDEVAAVWRAIFEGDAQPLADRIRAFQLTPESVRSELAKTGITLVEKAFRTILKNRVNRGGILAPGAGMLKYGENGRGLRSRWYPKTLAKRILDIAAMRDRVAFLEEDAFQVLRRNAGRADAVFFLDPPYTAGTKRAGQRLYKLSQIDHEELFRVVGTLAGDFLMTYDDDDEVRGLAQRHGLDMQAVAMKGTHHTKMTELLIGRNLDWAG